jgi:hypothetical protein
MCPSPTREDVTKLNAEVNEYLNQQVTLLVTAVSIVGVVIAWVSQKIDPSDITTLDVAYLGASSLLAFLAVIAVIEARLDVSIAICTAYLRIKEASIWERDKARFNVVSRYHRRIKLTSRQTVYLALGGLASGWPAILATVVFRANTISTLSALHIVVSGVFVIVVFKLVPMAVRARIEEIEETWREVHEFREMDARDDG